MCAYVVRVGSALPGDNRPGSSRARKFDIHALTVVDIEK